MHRLPSISERPDAHAPGRCGAAPDLAWEVLADKVRDLIVLADSIGRITYVSTACRLYGYEPHELIGREPSELVHPDDRGHFSANSAALFTPGGAVEADSRQHRFQRRDGAWVWLEGNPSLLQGPGGEPVGLINVFRDVTEKRAAAAALREQAQRAEMAEQVAGVGYWRLDAVTGGVTWSEQMFEMYGVPPGREPPLDAAMALTHPDDHDVAMARIERALKSGVGWSDQITRIRRPDRETRYLSGRAVCERNAAGEVTAVFGTAMDVTEQRLARDRVVESERRYRVLTEHATDMISLTACDGRHLYLSPSVERVTGYPLAELMPRQMREFVHPDDLARFIAFYSDLITGKRRGGQPIRYRARHAGGDWIWLESMPRLVKAARPGAPDEIADVTRDVTEQQGLKEHLKAALAESELAAQVKSEFLSNMSHEIRTPLTAVLGYTGLLAQRADLDVTARGYVERIAVAGRGLLAIVNDVLDFSQLEAGLMTVKPRPTQPLALAREVLGMFELAADARGLALNFEASGEIPETVALDPDRLRQTLVNLVGNAVKFTDAGAVGLSVRYDQADERLALEVSDTGAGISASAQERLFQRFSQVDGSSTRAKGGAGLGLAICRGLAEAMGGSITLRSRVGHGSTFRLDLPAPEVELAPDETSGVRLEALAGLRVLAADDNPVNLELVRALLEPYGVELSEAHDGEQAVEAASLLPVDLILMDMRMPRMDGLAAAMAIRRGEGPNRDVPILSFSADHDSRAASRWAAVFSGHVSKPLQPADLITAILAVLSEGDPRILEAVGHGGA